MTMIKTVDPTEWQSFLGEFSERNRGRRARFELFGRSGTAREEDQEGYFEEISIADHTVNVKRTYEKHGETETMSDDISEVRGITVQLDSDGSEDVIELSDVDGNLTSLHFESMVDGEN
jgi:hypothetical protein